MASGGVGIAGEGMADQNDVAQGVIGCAIGFVGDGDGLQGGTAVEFQGVALFKQRDCLGRHQAYRLGRLAGIGSM